MLVPHVLVEGRFPGEHFPAFRTYVLLLEMYALNMAIESHRVLEQLTAEVTLVLRGVQVHLVDVHLLGCPSKKRSSRTGRTCA